MQSLIIQLSLNSEALGSRRILNIWEPHPYNYHSPPSLQ